MDPLESDQMAQARELAKRQLRRRQGALRSAHPSAALALRSQRIVEQLLGLPLFGLVRTIAAFWPIADKHEVDLRALDAAARSDNKQLYYPFMDPKHGGYETGFRRVDDVSELTERGRGFLEPDPSAPRAARGDIELVIVPALAIAEDGHRLGYGSGFYDVTLPEFCPPARSIAVAFDFQLLAELPVTDTDVRCDVIVTDCRIINPAPPPPKGT